MLSVMYHRLLDVLGAAAAVLVLLVMLGICADVLLRSVTGSSIIWMFEVSEYALMYLPCLGMAWLARENGHIAITTFVDKCGPVSRRRLAQLTTAACVLVCGLIAYWGAVVFVQRLQRGSVSVQAIEVPDYLIYWVIPFGFGLAAIEFMRQLLGGKIHVPAQHSPVEQGGADGLV